MGKPRNFALRLKGKVLLVGYDTEGQNVYSAFLSKEKYEAGKHPWDDPARLKALALRTIHGYVFNEAGMLEQEFESQFDLRVGVFERGWSRNEEGIVDEY